MQKQPQENRGPGVALRAAAPAEREKLFREIYDAELRDIVQRCGRDPRALQMGTNDKFTNYVRRIVGRGKVVLEIGCGFGSTAIAVGGSANELIGIDTAPVAVEVAREFTAERPNLRFAVMDAHRLDFPDEHFDAAYSIDMLEHLHPDDIPAHLGEVHRVLKPGGFYFVKTPSDLSGPHGGSAPDDPHSPHLREYRYGSLLPLLEEAGFGRLYAPAFSMRVSSRIPGPPRFPASLNLLSEAITQLAPRHSAARNWLSRFLGVKQVMVVARKRVARPSRA